MITLAQITNICYTTNLCNVYVPLFESTLEATMLLPPGIHSGYKENDIVFLSFTENDLGRPIVLGQLYLGNTREILEKDQAGSISCEFLEVENEFYYKGNELSAILTNLRNTISTLTDKVNTLEAKIDTLTSTAP